MAPPQWEMGAAMPAGGHAPSRPGDAEAYPPPPQKKSFFQEHRLAVIVAAITLLVVVVVLFVYLTGKRGRGRKKQPALPPTPAGGPEEVNLEELTRLREARRQARTQRRDAPTQTVTFAAEKSAPAPVAAPVAVTAPVAAASPEVVQVGTPAPTFTPVPAPDPSPVPVPAPAAVFTPVLAPAGSLHPSLDIGEMDDIIDSLGGGSEL